MLSLSHFVNSNRIQSNTLNVFQSQMFSVKNQLFLSEPAQNVETKNLKSLVKIYFLNRFLPCPFTDVLRQLVNNFLDSVF